MVDAAQPLGRRARGATPRSRSRGRRGPASRRRPRRVRRAASPRRRSRARCRSSRRRRAAAGPSSDASASGVLDRRQHPHLQHPVGHDHVDPGRDLDVHLVARDGDDPDARHVPQDEAAVVGRRQVARPRRRLVRARQHPSAERLGRLAAAVAAPLGDLDDRVVLDDTSVSALGITVSVASARPDRIGSIDRWMTSSGTSGRTASWTTTMSSSSPRPARARPAACSRCGSRRRPPPSPARQRGRLDELAGLRRSSRVRDDDHAVDPRAAQRRAASAAGSGRRRGGRTASASRRRSGCRRHPRGRSRGSACRLDYVRAPAGTGRRHPGAAPTGIIGPQHDREASARPPGPHRRPGPRADLGRLAADPGAAPGPTRRRPARSRRPPTPPRDQRRDGPGDRLGGRRRRHDPPVQRDAGPEARAAPRRAAGSSSRSGRAAASAEIVQAHRRRGRERAVGPGLVRRPPSTGRYNAVASVNGRTGVVRDRPSTSTRASRTSTRSRCRRARSRSPARSARLVIAIRVGLVRRAVLVHRLLARRNGRRILFSSDSRADLGGNLKLVYDRMVERGLDREFELLTLFKLEHRRAAVDQGPAPAAVAAGARGHDRDRRLPAGHLPRERPRRHDRPAVARGGGVQDRRLQPGRQARRADAVRRVHKNYTWATVSAHDDIAVYAEAFGIPESHVVATGHPARRPDVRPRAPRRGARRRRRRVPRDRRPDGDPVRADVPRPRREDRDVRQLARIDVEALHALCVERDAVCLVRMHPFVREPLADPGGAARPDRRRVVDPTAGCHARSRPTTCCSRSTS